MTVTVSGPSAVAFSPAALAASLALPAAAFLSASTALMAASHWSRMAHLRSSGMSASLMALTSSDSAFCFSSWSSSVEPLVATMSAANLSASAHALAARSPVYMTMRRTPFISESSEMTTAALTSPKLVMCVPPHNSIEYCFHSSDDGLATRSSTGRPMEMTVHGSGYLSSKLRRIELISPAWASGTRPLYTVSFAAMALAISASTSATSCGASLPFQEKSKRRLSSDTYEPRWDTSMNESGLRNCRTSRRAWFSWCVVVWLTAMGARRT
mmetsp:Transcript_27687/g.85783  ORF Transcript_27687/g.85783 Transcript_27687/m.85783 type:complete len:270 (-) Transcript_27687:312-1121(-)